MPPPSASPLTVQAPAEAVIDSNAVLDWLLFQDASAQAMGQAVIDGRLRWIGTAAMADELADVLARPAFDRWNDRRGAVACALHRHCHRVTPPLPPASGRLWCTDSDDQMFIDLAQCRRAPWLFSRDKALLSLSRRARSCGLQICTPAHWSTMSP